MSKRVINMAYSELYHYGRKGMKWGQSIFGKVQSRITGRRDAKKAYKDVRSTKKKSKKVPNRLLNASEKFATYDQLYKDAMKSYSDSYNKSRSAKSDNDREMYERMAESYREQANTHDNKRRKSFNKVVSRGFSFQKKKEYDEALSSAIERLERRMEGLKAAQEYINTYSNYTYMGVYMSMNDEGS